MNAASRATSTLQLRELVDKYATGVKQHIRPIDSRPQNIDEFATFTSLLFLLLDQCVRIAFMSSMKMRMMMTHSNR